MIKIENTKIFNITRAVYSARNAMNSWNRSDSDLDSDILGPNDYNLAIRLARSGTDHRKYLRMITVIVDITAPLYFWKEHDQYKVGTVSNSSSTMHKIHAKEFALEDFSHEHLTVVSTDSLKRTINDLNSAREGYFDEQIKQNPELRKEFWWQMIQLLPSSYNQRRTVQMNYEVLANIYKSRNGHKLDEWREFCKWIRNLPCSELITGKMQQTNDT